MHAKLYVSVISISHFSSPGPTAQVSFSYKINCPLSVVIFVFFQYFLINFNQD